MIIGIGSDLIDIRRVAKVIERHGDRRSEERRVGKECLE